MAHTHEQYPESDCVACLFIQSINWTALENFLADPITNESGNN
jgi:hypothetical protein